MAINKKLIHFKTKENFNKEVANGNILETSIVFIQDTKEVYTHGTFYDCSAADFSEIEDSIQNLHDNKADKVEVSELNAILVDANAEADDPIVSETITEAKKEIIFMSPFEISIDIARPNVVYWIDGTNIIIDSFEPPKEGEESFDEFTIFFSYSDPGPGGSESMNVSLSLPEYVRWANGNIPDVSELKGNGVAELSIVRMSDGFGLDYYNAVLTPFKSV